MWNDQGVPQSLSVLSTFWDCISNGHDVCSIHLDNQFIGVVQLSSIVGNELGTSYKHT